MPAPAPAVAPPRVLTPDDRYDRCEALVVRLEGGYANNPKDPGGPTNKGVTLRALEAHRGRACTANDVRALTDAEVLQIYHETYWSAVCGDQLPPGVDLIVFDAGVNCGRGRAATFLQRGLGIAADSTIGPVTLGALARCNDLDGLVERIRLTRLAYYKGLATFPEFGTGWLKRLNTVAVTAAAWARRG